MEGMAKSASVNARFVIHRHEAWYGFLLLWTHVFRSSTAESKSTHRCGAPGRDGCVILVRVNVVDIDAVFPPPPRPLLQVLTRNFGDRDLM